MAFTNSFNISISSPEDLSTRLYTSASPWYIFPSSPPTNPAISPTHRYTFGNIAGTPRLIRSTSSGCESLSSSNSAALVAGEFPCAAKGIAVTDLPLKILHTQNHCREQPCYSFRYTLSRSMSHYSSSLSMKLTAYDIFRALAWPTPAPSPLRILTLIPLFPITFLNSSKPFSCPGSAEP